MLADLLEHRAARLTRRLGADAVTRERIAGLLGSLVHTLRRGRVDVQVVRSQVETAVDLEALLSTTKRLHGSVYDLLEDREADVVPKSIRLLGEWFATIQEIALREQHRRAFAGDAVAKDVSLHNRSVSVRRRLADETEMAELLYAKRLEQASAKAQAYESAVNAFARLAGPELADWCMVDIIEDGRGVRRTFAHRDPEKSAAIGTLASHAAELHDFAEGRRAIAGESLLFQLTPDHFRRGTPERPDLGCAVGGTTVILVPIVALGKTFAVVSFVRMAQSGRRQGPDDVAHARELARRAVVLHAGFPGPRSTEREDVRLRRVEEFLRGNLGTPMSLQQVAREAGLSRFHFLRLFKQAYGLTPFKHLTRLRMEEAKQRLARGDESVTDIAYACGYEDAAHFASAFRREVGVSPRRYRQRFRRRQTGP
jgi:AraC-like DNA-binding protein